MTDSVTRALTGRIVMALRGDGQVETILFSLKPRLHPFDDRVYSSTADLPEDPPELRSTLPRIIVEVRETPFDTEQKEADVESGFSVCDVWVHCLSESSQEDLGQRLEARSRRVLLSTPLTDASIIVGELVPTGYRVLRETLFRDAHRLTREFRTHAGVR